VYDAAVTPAAVRRAHPASEGESRGRAHPIAHDVEIARGEAGVASATCGVCGRILLIDGTAVVRSRRDGPGRVGVAAVEAHVELERAAQVGTRWRGSGWRTRWWTRRRGRRWRGGRLRWLRRRGRGRRAWRQVRGRRCGRGLGWSSWVVGTTKLQIPAAVATRPRCELARQPVEHHRRDMIRRDACTVEARLRRQAIHLVLLRVDGQL